MNKYNHIQTQVLYNTCVLVTGLGVGWLVGLSVSPVLSIVITSVTGSAAAIVAALSGLEDRTNEIGSEGQHRVWRWNVNPMPLALLMIGILTGSIIGILARNNHWLGSDISSEILKWTDQGINRKDILDRLFEVNYPYSPYSTTYTQTLDAEVTHWTQLGLSREKVVQQLFDKRYASNTTTESSKVNSDSRLGTYLFATDVNECDNLLAASEMSKAMSNGQILTEAFKSSTDKRLRQLPTIVTDAKILQSIVENILCTNG